MHRLAICSSVSSYQLSGPAALANPIGSRRGVGSSYQELGQGSPSVVPSLRPPPWSKPASGMSGVRFVAGRAAARREVRCRAGFAVGRRWPCGCCLACCGCGCCCGACRQRCCRRRARPRGNSGCPEAVFPTYETETGRGDSSIGRPDELPYRRSVGCDRQSHGGRPGGTCATWRTTMRSSCRVYSPNPLQSREEASGSRSVCAAPRFAFGEARTKRFSRRVRGSTCGRRPAERCEGGHRSVAPGVQRRSSST